MEQHGSHDHEHAHGSHDHEHTHGAIDPGLLSSKRGIHALMWSLLIMMLTAGIQVFLVVITGSVALLADTVHNFGDALTAVPLWVAFKLGTKEPTDRYTYGLGRIEDLAGIFIVLVILSSAIFAGYETILRFLHPQKMTHVWVVAVAGAVGFVGNEAVALYRLKVGKEIGSAALIADGYHARIDGLTSLAVLVGAIGVWLGFPLADPIMGLIITLAILRIVWQAGKSVLTRLLDGIDPEVVVELVDTAPKVPGVLEVTDARVRWIGHRMHSEVNIAVSSELSVERGHEIAMDVRHRLLHQLSYLSDVVVHVDPENASGEQRHRIARHEHDDLEEHSH